MSKEQNNLDFFGIKGECKRPFIELAPITNQDGYLLKVNLENKEAVDNLKQCVIDEMIKKCTRSNITTVTKYENIGGVVYPVNYHSNGMITMDYPELPLFKDKPDGIK